MNGGERPVRVGVFGTSWWADAMYLPALADHPRARVEAVCGRQEATTRSFAERWSIPTWFTDPAAMLAGVELDAVVISTPNDSHHPLALAALEAGLDVLCEKPLALDARQAGEMADLAHRRGAITLVPFTYRYMPMVQWLKRLIDDGFVGRPRQLNLRYSSGYGLGGEYQWRFDREIAGTGIIGDLGSHLIHLARWLIDDRETSASAVGCRFVDRGPRPDGAPYEAQDDSAVLTVRYRSGACGVLHVTAAAWEGAPDSGQRHELDIHGDGGTLHARCDWDQVQEVRGSRLGESTTAVLPIPDDLWGRVRRHPVTETFRDVFHTTDAMTRGWIEAVAERRPVQPDFTEGLAVQRVIDAAMASAADGGCPVDIEH